MRKLGEYPPCAEGVPDFDVDLSRLCERFSPSFVRFRCGAASFPGVLDLGRRLWLSTMPLLNERHTPLPGLEEGWTICCLLIMPAKSCIEEPADAPPSAPTAPKYQSFNSSCIALACSSVRPITACKSSSRFPGDIMKSAVGGGDAAGCCSGDGILSDDVSGCGGGMLGRGGLTAAGVGRNRIGDAE